MCGGVMERDYTDEAVRDYIDEAVREAQQCEVRRSWARCSTIGSHMYWQLPRDVRDRVYVDVRPTADGTKLLATFYNNFKGKAEGRRLILECTLDGYRIPDEVIAHLCVVV
jgi:hypothetical protein